MQRHRLRSRNGDVSQLTSQFAPIGRWGAPSEDSSLCLSLSVKRVEVRVDSLCFAPRAARVATRDNRESTTSFFVVPTPSKVVGALIFALGGWIADAAPTALGQTPGADRGNEALQIKAIGEAYLANRESFPFFHCRFTLSDGVAENLNDAIARGPTRDVTVADCVWIVDGDRVRYERIPRGPMTPKSAGGTSFTVPISPEIYLTAGEFGLYADLVLSGGGLASPNKRAPKQVTMTPWDLVDATGHGEEYSPGALIQKFHGMTQATFHIRATEQRLGRRTVPLDVNIGIPLVFYLDPERGYLPIEMQSFMNGQVFAHTFTTDVRACSNNRWFPERTVIAWPKPGDDGPLRVRELRITELEVDEPPDDDEFALVAPQDLRFHNGVDNTARVKVEAGRRIHVDDLPALVAESEHRILPSDAPLSASSSLRRWLIAANVAILLTLCAIAFYRRHKRRHRAR